MIGCPLSGNRIVAFGGNAWNSTIPWQPSRRHRAVRSQRLKSEPLSRSMRGRFACILSPQVALGDHVPALGQHPPDGGPGLSPVRDRLAIRMFSPHRLPGGVRRKSQLSQLDLRADALDDPWFDALYLA